MALFYQTLLGTTQEILFEEEKEGMWTGLTDNYARVSMPSQTDLRNQLNKVRLIAHQGTDLLAEPLGPFSHLTSAGSIEMYAK